MLNNYRIHVLEVRRFLDTGLFQTDLRYAFEFIQRSDDKAAMFQYTEEHHETFEELEEDTYDVIAALTGADELVEVKGNCLEGGKVNMCRALTELIKDGELRGLQKGEQKGALQKSRTVAHNMFLRGIPAEDAAALCSEELELIKSWYHEWQ